MFILGVITGWFIHRYWSQLKSFVSSCHKRIENAIEAFTK